MSRANLPPLGIVLTVDDSQALASVRSAYAKLQAEVESRGLKVPLTVEANGNGRAATFGSPGIAPTLASTAGFAPNRPVQPGTGYGFDVAPSAMSFSARAPAVIATGGTGEEGIASIRGQISSMRSQLGMPPFDPNAEASGEAAAASTVAARSRGGGYRGRRMLAYGLIAAREIQRASFAQDQGDRDALMATTPGEELKARITEQRSAWGGLFGTAGGFALDLFNRGPESFNNSASRVLSFSESQDRLRAQQIASGFAGQERAAMAAGDTIERRRIQVRRSLSGVQEENLPQIRDITSKLGETKEDFASFGSSGEINTRTVQKVQGSDRDRLQNELRRLQGQLNDAVKDAAAQIEDINRDVEKTRREMHVASRVAILRAAGRDTAADFAETLGRGANAIIDAPPELKSEAMQLANADLMGTIGNTIGAGLNRFGRFARSLRGNNRQARILRAAAGSEFQGRMAEINEDEQEQIGETQSLPAWLRWLPQMGIRNVSSARRELEQSRLDRERKTMDIRSEAQGRAIDQIRDKNPIGAASTISAASAIAEATSLVGPEFSKQRKDIIRNAISQQQNVAQNYADSFRAVQFDTRTSFFNPRDQEDATTILKSINDNILKLYDKLTVEQ